MQKTCPQRRSQATLSPEYRHYPVAAVALAGTLLGGIVHLIAVLVLPRTATQDAYSRLSPIAPVNAVAPLPEPTPQNAVMPFMDPAFASAVCRYDLAAGPIKLTVPISPAYTSVSLLGRGAGSRTMRSTTARRAAGRSSCN